jgi:hypothetical protein
MNTNLKNILCVASFAVLSWNVRAQDFLSSLSSNLNSFNNSAVNFNSIGITKNFSPAAAADDDIEDNIQKFGSWMKIFGNSYNPTAKQKEQPINYSYRNFGTTAAVEMKPNKKTLFGLAYTFTDGTIEVSKIFNASTKLQTSGGSAFGSIQLFREFIRTEFVVSMHYANANVKDKYLQQLLQLKDGGRTVRASLFDSKIKLVLDSLPLSNVSMHPYIGFDYNNLYSKDLQQLNNNHPYIYHSYYTQLGVSAIGYYNIKDVAVSPSVYLEYAVLLNPGTQEDSTPLQNNFNFGNNFTAGSSVAFSKGVYIFEAGYEFNRNRMVIGQNGFVKLKIAL